MIVKLIVDGGAMKPGPSVSQQLGPMGINLGKVIEEVNRATSSFKGVKVPVEINVNAKTKEFTVNVFSPPVAELLKKELKIEKGSGETKKTKIGNLAIEQVIAIAKTKFSNTLAKSLKSAVKLVIGSCVSLGILIENKEAKDIMRELEEGKYNKEISEEKTEVPQNKKAELDKFFSEIKAKQEAAAKVAEAAKAAEEASKTTVAVEGAKPEEKKEEKKEVKEETKTERKRK